MFYCIQLAIVYHHITDGSYFMGFFAAGALAWSNPAWFPLRSSPSKILINPPAASSMGHEERFDLRYLPLDADGNALSSYENRELEAVPDRPVVLENLLPAELYMIQIGKPSTGSGESIWSAPLTVTPGQSGNSNNLSVLSVLVVLVVLGAVLF